MLNISKFKLFILPAFLLVSVLLTNQLTLSAADGAPRITAATALRSVDRDLLKAVTNDNAAAVTTALAAGADANASNYGFTALMYAAMSDHDHTEILTQLLAAGADVNARSNDGLTALVGAVRDGHSAIVTQLLAAGADVNARDNDGYTALSAAILLGYTEIVTQLLDAGAKIPEHL